MVASFRSGRRVCLTGALAVGLVRDRFAVAIGGHFGRRVDALAVPPLLRALETAAARPGAAEIVLSIQGAIVPSRAG